MRAFYRVPLALWEDPETPAGSMIPCGTTTASVYAMADQRQPASEDAGAVFLGNYLSELTTTQRKHFVRTRVRRLVGEGDEASLAELLVVPDAVELDDEVLEEGVPAALFAGDTPADILAPPEPSP